MRRLHPCTCRRLKVRRVTFWCSTNRWSIASVKIRRNYYKQLRNPRHECTAPTPQVMGWTMCHPVLFIAAGLRVLHIRRRHTYLRYDKFSYLDPQTPKRDQSQSNFYVSYHYHGQPRPLQWHSGVNRLWVLQWRQDTWSYIISRHPIMFSRLE